jgi:hypothetical protein
VPWASPFSSAGLIHSVINVGLDEL